MIIINTRPQPVCVNLSGLDVLDLFLFQYAKVTEAKQRLADISLSPNIWIVFTSANGIRYAESNLVQKCGRQLSSFRVAVVGKKTADIARKAGFNVVLTAQSGHAEGLARELVEYQRVKGGPREALLLRAKTATVDLPVILRQAGWTVEEVPVYQSLPREIPSDLERQIKQLDEAIVLLTSGETAKRFMQMFEPSKFYAVVIGPKTHEAVKDMGFRIIRQAAEPTEKALLEEAKNLNDSLEALRSPREG